MRAEPRDHRARPWRVHHSPQISSFSIRAYMALIKPFRHWIVYPAWIVHLRRTWTVLHPLV